MNSSHMPRNRMLDVRMKDSKRWALMYRKWAYAEALAEERAMTVLGRIHFAFHYMLLNWNKEPG